jgi:hypothetical protein
MSAETLGKERMKINVGKNKVADYVKMEKKNKRRIRWRRNRTRQLKYRR